jgi:hypothetical protein
MPKDLKEKISQFLSLYRVTVDRTHKHAMRGEMERAAVLRNVIDAYVLRLQYEIALIERDGNADGSVELPVLK